MNRQRRDGSIREPEFNDGVDGAMWVHGQVLLRLSQRSESSFTAPHRTAPHRTATGSG
jgi:hypothetical protein